MYRPDVPFPVYSVEEWNSDVWNPKDYGKKIDFSRPFFEQYKELLDVIPHATLHVLGASMENTAYANSAAYCKDSYLVFSSGYVEKSMYGFVLEEVKDTVDNLRVRKSELCYEGIDLENCYNCQYLQDCQGCTDSAFLYQCTSCSNCFGSVNLKNKQYVWFNEQLSKEEYERKVSEVDLGNRQVVQKIRTQFEAHKRTFPKLAFHGSSNETVTGDYLYNCKNALDCYDGFNIEDSRFCNRIFLGIKDAYDCFDNGDRMSLAYEVTHSFAEVYNAKFSYGLVGCNNVEYSQVIHGGGNDLFGCFGLKNSSHCILNTAYTQHEYANLRTQLIGHMKETGEYGEFFPASLSPFGYNETLANLYLPLSQDQATAEGFAWHDQKREVKPQTSVVPEKITDVQDTILQETLTDPDGSFNFKITKQELEFYRSRSIPIPSQSFFSRNRARWQRRNQNRLWSTTCAKCGKKIDTTWDPARGETVYCREDFYSEVV